MKMANASLVPRLGWLLMMALAGLVLGGCPLDENNGGSGGDAGDAGDVLPDGDTDADQFRPYRYVLILDQESIDTGGIELDAVALIQGGETYYADDWHECIQGPGIENVTTTRDCNMALGSPNNEAGECESDDTFYVNLGGLGGSIIVSFDAEREIETGDAIRVYECGRVADDYKVDVGVGTSVTDPDWVRCLEDGSGVAECTVPELPPVPVE
jgi:hypothetical protein